MKSYVGFCNAAKIRLDMVEFCHDSFNCSAASTTAVAAVAAAAAAAALTVGMDVTVVAVGVVVAAVDIAATAAAAGYAIVQAIISTDAAASDAFILTIFSKLAEYPGTHTNTNITTTTTNIITPPRNDSTRHLSLG